MTFFSLILTNLNPSMFLTVVETSAAVDGQIGFQDPATAVMEAIINFHNDLFFYLVLVVCFVAYLLARCIMLFRQKVHPVPDTFVHGTVIEIVWTLTPALVLIVIALPSFSLLYSMDEVINPEMTIKAIGHQWYWSYEYSDIDLLDGTDIAYDSYMLTDDQLPKGTFRLLEAPHMIVPVATHIRLITTSADVIHSWTVPSFGIKLDACPGRLNQTSLFARRKGIFYGQCSEICGVNHGFMPISVAVVPEYSFIKFMAFKAQQQGTQAVFDILNDVNGDGQKKEIVETPIFLKD